MENEQEINSKLTGFRLTVENTKRLILYVASLKVDDIPTTQSKVVNEALDLFFETKAVRTQLEKIA